MAGHGQHQVDWGVIFDLIAAEYGYTWERFTGMTYKLLHVCLDNISRRRHDDKAAYAAMHGIKVSLYHETKPPSEKLIQQAENQGLELLKRKRAQKRH